MKRDADAGYWDVYNAKRRDETRRRQVQSLRHRRLTHLPREVNLLRIVASGLAELDRLEARGVPMSVLEVAASLGLSAEAVRQIEARAIAKIREALGIQEWGP